MDRSEIKKRDAEATRERILVCAQKLFSEKGYDATGTREIAACANVNSSLVERYFGSKKELFEAAILPAFDISEFLELENDAFPSVVAKLFATKPPKDEFDPITALLRSAGSTEVGEVVRSAMMDQAIAPMSQKLTGQNPEQRAAILFALLAGFDLFRRTIGVSALGAEDESKAQRLLEDILHSLIRTAD